MEFRLARFLAIAIVIAVLGGMVLSGRARKLERQLAPPPPAVSTAAGPPDSARAVALALHAYQLDHAAWGETPGPARVTAFTPDSLGFVIELAPGASGRGARAVVRVRRTGEVELRRLAP